MKKKATPKKKLEKAHATLLALLRSPKSKAGLRAALEGPGLSIHFLTGWLSQQIRKGVVIPVHQTHTAEPLYVLGQATLQPDAPPSDYPTWLEPRQLPRFDSRYLVSMLEGTPEQQQQQQEEEEPDENTQQTDRRPQRCPECGAARG